MKRKRGFYSLILTIPVTVVLILLVGCERKDEPSRRELLTSTWWTLTEDCGTPVNCGESCKMAFNPDGYCIEEEYYNGFTTWSLKDEDEILVIDQEDYKILELTETKLKFKKDWLLGCTYTYKSISITPKVETRGVSDLTTTSAKLYGYVKTDKATVTAKIEYGTTTSYGSTLVVRNIPRMNSMYLGVQMQDFFNPETTYHYRFIAVEGSVTYYGQDLTFRTFNELTVSDINGNIYNTISIGSQTWMAENLKVNKFDDGNSIPLVSNDSVWGSLTSPGYCWSYNDSVTYKDTYGALYNWYAVTTGNLCPTGWHVPGDQEWTTLVEILGQDVINKMFEGGYPVGGTNESGFSAIGTYYRQEDGYFSGITGWWSSTEENSSNAWALVVPEKISYSKKYGYSVRCIKDQ
jgi:uncharacterized protein (TIGR02145 family)